TGIGASDAAAICGLSTWSTPYVVWLDKTGRVPLDHGDGADSRMLWGQRLEQLVLDSFEERTGMRVIHRGELVRHATNPWMLATLDGVAVEDTHGILLGVFEAKTSTGRDGQWRDGVPDAYVLQVQHQLEVTGLERAWVPVLLGGQDFEIHELVRDDALVELLLDMEQYFWHHHVLGDVPPAMDTSRRTEDALRLAHPGVAG